MKTTVVLTGPDTGKTVLMHGKQFIKGELVCIAETPQLLEYQLRYVGRVCQAFPVGSDQLAAAQERDIARGFLHKPETNSGEDTAGPGRGSPESVPANLGKPSGGIPEIQPDGRRSDSERAPDGQEGLGAGGDGHAHSGIRPGQVKAIKDAVAKLDPLKDTDWSDAGQPSVEVICAMVGDPTVTRAMIDFCEGDASREKAFDSLPI